MIKLKKISLVILILFYFIAGINHFRNPASYIKIIPSYFPYPEILNLLAGFFEISFGLLLIFIKTRTIAAWGIILMLLTFLPVHIKMVADAPFLLGNITITPLIAWIRLIILQPMLILWAYWHIPTKKID